MQAIYDACYGTATKVPISAVQTRLDLPDSEVKIALEYLRKEDIITVSTETVDATLRPQFHPDLIVTRQDYLDLMEKFPPQYVTREVVQMTHQGVKKIKNALLVSKSQASQPASVTNKNSNRYD